MRIVCLASFAVGVFAMLLYQPFVQPEAGDNAIWDYVAQCIVRGQAPYRDVIEIKTPGSAYLSALAMSVGKAAGLQDILSVRALYILLVGILCSVTFLTAQVYLRSLAAGIIAVLLLVAWPGMTVMMAAGTRPKAPMIILGLITLLLIAAEKPFIAGACSMLSCLCWQPGLLFTAAALLIFSQYLTSWRDLRALKVLIGATVPLGLLLIYFYSAGVLRDFWSWTVVYNYRVYMPEGSETAAVSLSRLWHLIGEAAGGDTIWVKIAAVGYLLYCGERIWAKFNKTSDSHVFKDALAIVPLLYLIFKVINYPGIDDLIPLFPFIGLFAGYFFIAASRWIAQMRLARKHANAARFARWIPTVPVLILAVLALIHGWSYEAGSGLTLPDQQTEVKAIADILGPDDRIYVHGSLEILVLLNRPNMNPYIFLDRGKDTYLGAQTPGGFSAIMDEMKSQRPKVIAVSRIQNVAHRDELLTWAAQEYDRLPVGFAHNSVFVRKPD